MGKHERRQLRQDRDLGGQLPRYLVVSIAVPTYRGASTDRPGAKMLCYLAVHPDPRGAHPARAAARRVSAWSSSASRANALCHCGSAAATVSGEHAR